MEAFYITHDEFWDWFNRDYEDEVAPTNNGKRLKREVKEKPRSIQETEAGVRTDTRYSIMYCPHKPGKKTKVWTGDGYLSMVNRMAHLCDLRGRMLEEPTVLDDIDYRAVEELGELIIGNTEVQVVEIDK